MANQFANTTDAVYNLKKWYQGPIKDQFNEDVPIYRGADRMKYKWNGEEVKRPLRVLRNPGIGATSDGGPLPAIGIQGGVQATIQAKYNYLRWGITGPMIAASQNDRGSFVRQQGYEMEMATKDLAVDCNRQNSWDGTGTLARLNAGAGGSQTIVVKGREDGEPALKFLSQNMVIDIYNGSTKVAASVTIESISSGTALGSTATILLDTAVTVSENDTIVRANSKGYEVQGLLTQLDGQTTTVFGIDRSQYIQTQGNVLDLNGNQLTLDALQQGWNLGRLRGGAKYAAIYSDFDSERFYNKLLTADKRYVNTVKGDGSFASKDGTYLEWGGLPWVSDQSCPKRIFFLPNDGIEKAVLWEMAWADETGSEMIAQVGSDALEARLRLFYNLFNAMAASSVAIQDYTSP